MADIKPMTPEERRELVETTPYQWETCIVCGRSEKEYFLETGWSMLMWHVKAGMLCEYCVADYPDDEDDEEE